MKPETRARTSPGESDPAGVNEAPARPANFHSESFPSSVSWVGNRLITVTSTEQGEPESNFFSPAPPHCYGADPALLLEEMSPLQVIRSSLPLVATPQSGSSLTSKSNFI